MNIYDPRYHTFDSWTSLMCEMFAGQQLAIPDSTPWYEWGAGLKAIDVFANEAIPETKEFDDWQEWAQAVVGAMNGR